MKTLLFLAVTSSVLLGSISNAAQVAQARLYCISVKLNQATDAFDDTFSVNSTGTAAGVGELIPWGAPPIRELEPYPPILYTSVATLYDSLYMASFADGSFTLNLPELVDSDGNGYPDFFEVVQGIDTNATDGAYHFGFPVGNGPIWTAWQRAPGSSKGTCGMYLPDYQSTFNPTFQILEYTGTLSYTPASNSVSSSVALKQTGSPTSTLQGSLTFSKSPTDRYNTLTLNYGTLLDAAQQTHWFTNHVFTRNLSWPTNYSGYVEFDGDGTQNTPYPYAFWVLSITDTHDTNHDGIPDFSDDPASSPSNPPQPPQLSLTPSGTSLLLSIRGDLGHLHTIQTSPQFPGNWQDAGSFTLTNDPQAISLPARAGAGFWRVLAQ
jgi:hypothetical protein